MRMIATFDWSSMAEHTEKPFAREYERLRTGCLI